MRRYSIIPAVLFLAACQGGGSLAVRDATGVDRFTRFQGASLVLNHDLSIAAGKARVFLQNGEVSGGFDSYRTHCAFEIDSVRHDGKTIQAGTFTISRVQGSIQPVVTRGLLQVASLQLFAGLDGAGSQSFYEGYHFWLTSVDQPEVRRLSCFGVYAEPQDLYPPTVEEIRQALGSIAVIQQ